MAIVPNFTLYGTPQNLDGDIQKEMYLHASLAVWPQNQMTAKNLANELEWLYYIPPSVGDPPVSVIIHHSKSSYFILCHNCCLLHPH